MTLGEITAGSEDGFADLRLTMVSLARDPHGAQRLISRGLHKGRRVGFGISLGSTWEQQILESLDDPLYWGTADLISLGEESDAFLQALDEVYNTNTGRRRMRDRVAYLAVSLAGHPLRLDQESVKMKLFFESDLEERAAEFYLNVDAQNSSVEFHEKDADYRLGIILSLATA
jgi:hypothetical protein